MRGTRLPPGHVRVPPLAGVRRGLGIGSREGEKQQKRGAVAARKERWREERRSSGGQRGTARGEGRRAERSRGKAGAAGNTGRGSAEGVAERAGSAPTWHRHTISDSVASRSTTLPLPSSPHCAPSTTVTLLPPGSLRARFSPPAAGWPLRSLDARVPDMLGGRVAVAAAAAASRCLAPRRRRALRAARAAPPPPAFKGAAAAARPAPR